MYLLCVSKFTLIFIKLTNKKCMIISYLLQYVNCDNKYT